MGVKARASGSQNKIQPTSRSVRSFLDGLSDQRRQRESEIVMAIMEQASGQPPVMWGPSIVGFGSYRYEYDSGRTGSWARVGFSPRKSGLTIYCMPGFDQQQDLLANLGPHKTSVSCLYIRRLDDVDLDVLRKIVDRSLEQMDKRYGRSA